MLTIMYYLNKQCNKVKIITLLIIGNYNHITDKK